MVACAAVATANPQKAAAQGSCRVCEGCDENGHNNELSWFAIIGNHDDTHGCWGCTCAYMQANGVHKNDDPCSDYAAYEAVKAAKDLRPSKVRQLLVEFPKYVVLDRGRQYLQVLDCEGRHVVAQFELRRSPIARLTQRFQLVKSLRIKMGMEARELS